MADPVGSVFTSGFEEFVIQDEVGEGSVLLFLPPGNNDALQCERKAPVCYSIPERLQLTRNTFDETTASPLGSEVEGVYG